MHTAELPRAPIDDPDHVSPAGDVHPDDELTEVIPATGEHTDEPATAELPAARVDLDDYSREIPAHIKHGVGYVVLANDGGYAPYKGTKMENWLRPESPYWGWPVFRNLSPGHPHKMKVNAVQPKVNHAVKARQPGFDFGDHDRAVDAAQATIRSLAIKLHANEFDPAEAVIYHGAVDHTGHQRSGYGTVQYRRPWSRLATRAKMIRTPEAQVEAESQLALRDIGKMHNLDYHMAEVDALDESGQLGEALSGGDPVSVRRTLGRLSEAGVIPEHNPLHARWAEAMDPRNVQKFKQWIVENSSEQETGESPATALLHVAAAGIMGGVRPRAVADYLGVDFEDWDRQRYGFKSGENKLYKVPKEVVDQVCFLMKLDNRLVGGQVEGDDGKMRPRTALDVLIDYDAARPMTEVRRDHGHKTPMQRVSDPEAVAARAAREQEDRDRAEQELMNTLAGIDLEEFGRRLAELNADDEADREELERMSRQRASIIRRFRSHGVPIPAALRGDDSDS